MKKRNIQSKKAIPVLLVTLALACLPWPIAQADPPSPPGPPSPAIAGLWHEYYTSTVGGPPFETYTQWHSDGLEIETPNFLNGVCMGTFKQMGGRTFKLFHVGWTPGDPTSVRFELRELNTVTGNQNSFDGTYDQKFFDASGNLVAEDMGTIHATRLSVDQFVD
jgi:hypothetical protein